MTTKTIAHSFHIPIMGIGFTIDTPFKVAPYGISSSISLVDDILIEKMRKFYCERFDKPYQAISSKMDDFRAKRITAYLNLMQELVDEKFRQLKVNIDHGRQELDKYLAMLPDSSSIKQNFNEFIAKHQNSNELMNWLNENLVKGSIDVNIMTKLDKENTQNGEKLPVEFNDAHAALRGFAESSLESSIILSAGMNPRLYSYMDRFSDFFPTVGGYIKKKIILKTSDYRSALIQGKFLAKKGLWVSEFRIESGLNCGGHAFASDGYLMGPILEEFKTNRQSLREELWNMCAAALAEKDKAIPSEAPVQKITAQGGVGTAEEHEFLMEYYELDGIGWGTPFLLVPEATNVDPDTLELLSHATEKDLYLSDTSPLGVPFNSVYGNTKDQEKQEWIDKGRPGSACPKKYVALNKEINGEDLCTASRKFQHAKLSEIDTLELTAEEREQKIDKVLVKSCLCVGLGTPALLVNGIETRAEGPGVSVCPGPNMAYFSDVVSLKTMVDHIYGRTNIIHRTDRPNVFIKELGLYMDFLKKKMNEVEVPALNKNLMTFRKNLEDGMNYYQDLFSRQEKYFKQVKSDCLKQLESKKQELCHWFEAVTA
ncbi:MAG: hypothetical protein LCH37_11095 [Bacteroidetes bacterium]|nr:hypothetical protein [Bacteroidota bacterium]